MFFRTNRRWPCIDVRQAVVRTEEVLENNPLKAQAVSALPKGAPEKVVLAWWLGQQTTVPLRWVSERLKMGHYARDAGAEPAGAGPARRTVNVRRNGKMSQF